MRNTLTALALSVLLIAALAGLLMWTSGTDSPAADKDAIVLYCAAGMKAPVSAAAQAYEQEYGIPIHIQYGGSGTLLSGLKVAGQGDLYLAADASYTDMAHDQGLVAERIPAALLQPVIVTAKGNPKHIESVHDLARDDVRTALGLPEAASIGKQGQALLERLGAWNEVREAVETRGVFKPTVNEVAIDVKIGAMDAGIVWDGTAHQFPELDAVPIEGAGDFVQTVTVGVLTFAKQPARALHFARYLTARDKGLPLFKAEGFTPVEGDLWADVPEITYFSGGVNRVAIEKTLSEFEQREGCHISTVYNGCGILVAQMKAGERPDVYHSCDISFMRDIGDLFLPFVSVTETDMVLVTAKGNPKNLHTLKDLCAEGLRLGVANAEQSALGALTARMLDAEGLLGAVMKNVVSQTPTADLLVNQLRTGSLDAIIVYAANTTYAREDLEVIPLELKSAVATQTYAVGQNSDHKQLVMRFLDRLKTAESRERYAESGFRWLAK